MNRWNGITVVPSPFAVKVNVKWIVEPHNLQARRRRWRVRRVELTEPCAIQAAGCIFMHPTIYAKLAERAKGGAA